MKVYGPYTRKDGRKHVCIVHDNGRRQTMSYPKWLVQQATGYTTNAVEHVHHIDEDITNNSESNLEVLLDTTHKRLHNTKEYPNLVCIKCSKSFPVDAKRMGSEYRRIREQRRGPYCSKKCSGKDNQYS